MLIIHRRRKQGGEGALDFWFHWEFEKQVRSEVKVELLGSLLFPPSPNPNHLPIYIRMAV